MALIGNCKDIVYTNHETETTEETITQPDGTQETVQVPILVKTETDHTNIYLSIKQIEFITMFIGDMKIVAVQYHYAAYSDVETRQADQEDFIFWRSEQLESYDYEGNVYEQIYNEIKTKEGLTELIDG